MITITGPVTMHFHGATAEEITAIVAAQLAAALTPLGDKMTEISDFLDTANASVGAIQTALTDVAADVTALLARAGEAGAFSEEDQAKADAVSAKLTAVSDALGALDTAVGDEDGSETPAPPVE